MVPRNLTRRQFLTCVGTGATGLLLLAACAGQPPTPTPAPAKPAAQPPTPTSAQAKPAAEAPRPAPSPTAAAPKPTDTPAQKPAAKAGTVPLKLMSWDAPGTVLDEFLAGFDRAQGTSTEYIHVPYSGYREKLLTMLVGGVPADVMLIMVFEVPEFAARDQLLELDPYMRRDNFDTSDFFETALQAGRWKGKQHGIGDNFVYKILFYNTELFEKAGVQRPPADWRDRSWNWDKFLDAAVKLTKKESGQRPIQYGFAFGSGAVNVMPWVWSNGGELIDESYSKVHMAEPPAVEALQFLQDLQYKHGVAPTPDALATESLGKMASGGKVAMWWDGPWTMAGLRNTQLKWDIAPLPSGKAGSSSCAEGAVWSVAARSPQREKGWKLLEHLVSREGQLAMIKRFGFPGSRKSIAQSEAFLGVKPPEHTKVAAEGGQFARVMPRMVNWAEVNKAFNDSLSFLVNNEKSGKEVGQLLTDKITPLLAKAQG